jgi:hypothetical protein
MRALGWLSIRYDSESRGFIEGGKKKPGFFEKPGF